MFSAARLNPVPDIAGFRPAIRSASGWATRRYGVAVTTDVVGLDLKGDLDGEEIMIATACDPETTLFLVAHLFGHTVQWNTSAAARDLGMIAPTAMPPGRLGDVTSYEIEACRYGLTLLHEAGVHDLDQWLADYAACDRAYLGHFYATGTIGEFRRFWRDGQPLLEPLPIPAFVPRRWRLRSGGIVV
ncbi:MAG: hypothetical protein EBR28_07935 [Planctomycetia bacterium]|nr:hypothetical protein [Planctomycetia bacterium]